MGVMNTGHTDPNIAENQPEKVAGPGLVRPSKPKPKSDKPAWPDVLDAMCKKGMSEPGISAASIEEDWFNNNSSESKVEYLNSLLNIAFDELPDLFGDSRGIGSVPSIDLLSKNCLASIARFVALTAKAATGLMVVSKSGKMVQYADFGLPTSTASSQREILKKIAKESALKQAPRVSSEILDSLARIQEEKIQAQTAEPATPPNDSDAALQSDQKYGQPEQLGQPELPAVVQAAMKPDTEKEKPVEKEIVRLAGSVLLNDLSLAIDVPLVSIPLRLDDSSGVVVLLVEVRAKEEPAPPIDEFLAGAEHLWMSPQSKDALLKQLDAWYFIHRANGFMRTMGTLDWVRSQPRLWSSILCLVCVLLISPVPYYPKRECVFEPESKQFLSSPMQGRIASCNVRPGDQVTQGQLLGKLDDDQLQRDLAAARADFDGALKKRDSALATRAAGNAGIADIEMEQARLKIESLEEQLKRLEIRATNDGVVTQGDWQRNIGMPVTLGQSLFEVADLESMTAEVRLNAYDLEQINVGDEVSVRSDASGGETFRGRISRIEPRATIVDDAAVFIADVVIRDPERMLRPGMKANAQITAGWKPIGWLLFIRPYRWIANQWIW